MGAPVQLWACETCSAISAFMANYAVFGGSDKLNNQKLFMKTRLVILVSHPIQYFVPVWREIAADDSIDLTVVFLTRVGVDEYHDPGFGESIRWDIPLLDGYRSHFLSRKTSLGGIELSIMPWLIRARADVLLLHGYSQLTNLLALVVAKLLGIKVLMRGDTRLPQAGLSPGWKTSLKRFLFERFDGFISIGRLNASYYQALGVPQRKLHFSPIAVRNEFFAMSYIERLVAKDVMRKRLESPHDAIVILFASKLIKRKRAADLVAAFNVVAKSLPSVWLWIVGSGPEEAALKEMVVGKDRILFLGFKNQSQLPQIYAASDVFVLPSENEPWGLVINEAMAAGLPVVVTNDVGAAPDLVEGEDTGFTYPVGNIDRLGDMLRILAQDSGLRARMGRNAQTLISRWDAKSSAEGIVSAIDAVIPSRKLPRRRLCWFF